MGSDYTSQLFCNMGDVVEVIRRAEFYDDDSSTGKSFPEVGARYRVVGLVEWGWDMILESGMSPKQIRILNSTMPSIMRVDTTK